MIATHLIRSRSEYDAAQRRVAALIAARAKRGTPAGDELELLGLLITAYDDEHDPLGPADPIAAIRFQMNQRGLSRKDLEPFIGNRARVSDIMNRRRPLTLSMIRRLHEGLGIPLASLIESSEDDADRRQGDAPERSPRIRARPSARRHRIRGPA